MKRFLSLCLIVAVIISFFPMSASAAVKISKSNATMEIGSTLTLKVNGTSSKITWKSSQSNIATVSSKGVITAKADGTATISATVSKKQYSCIVKVVNSNRKEVTATKGMVTELSTGTYLIGEDFPAGKYNMIVKSGYGNFFVTGNDSYVNELVSEEGSEFYNTHSYSNLKLLYGDEMEITMGAVLEFTKLD